MNYLLDKKRLNFRVEESIYIPHRLEQHIYHKDLEKLEGSIITVYILILKEHAANI